MIPAFKELGCDKHVSNILHNGIISFYNKSIKNDLLKKTVNYALSMMGLLMRMAGTSLTNAISGALTP